MPVERKPPWALYSARVQVMRHLLRHICTNGVRFAAEDPSASMTWARERKSGIQRLVYRYGIELVLPDDVVLEAPSHISSIRHLQRIVDGFLSGEIYFRRVSSGEVTRLMRTHGLDADEARALRSDATRVCDLRPLDTRSPRLRKGTKNKTRETVSAEDDARAAAATDAERPFWWAVEQVVGVTTALETARWMARQQAPAGPVVPEDTDDIEEPIWSDDDDEWPARRRHAEESDIEDPDDW